MAQTLTTRTNGEPNPLDSTGLCLLSLDGGGVRGLSTLYILKQLMEDVNEEREKIQLPQVKPCELFDLIGGTSTGGYVMHTQDKNLLTKYRLIAIMLGRLKMDVDECITAYTDLMKTVFSQKLTRLPVDLKGRIKPQFNSMVLEQAIKQVIMAKGMQDSDLLNDGAEGGCRV